MLDSRIVPQESQSDSEYSNLPDLVPEKKANKSQKVSKYVGSHHLQIKLKFLIRILLHNFILKLHLGSTGENKGREKEITQVSRYLKIWNR